MFSLVYTNNAVHVDHLECQTLFRWWSPQGRLSHVNVDKQTPILAFLQELIDGKASCCHKHQGWQ